LAGYSDRWATPTTIFGTTVDNLLSSNERIGNILRMPLDKLPFPVPIEYVLDRGRQRLTIIGRDPADVSDVLAWIERQATDGAWAHERWMTCGSSLNNDAALAQR
jgi:hypothetical protein